MDENDIDRELSVISDTMSKIMEIYQKHRGFPDPKPPLKCTSCGQETTSYGCIVDLENPEFHFLCRHCGFGFITP
ncbi:MAG: hypothetical protein ACYC2T_14020 [Bacillota bacterium]